MLAGKKILVAGAGGLLGASVAFAILQNQGSIVAADIDTNLAEERLKAAGVDTGSGRVEICELDVTSEDSVAAFFAGAEGLSGAVNCTYPRNATYGAHFFDVTLQSFNENSSLHLGSAFLFCQQCARYFLKNNDGFSLVNLASIYGVVAPTFGIYDGTSMTMPVEYAAIKSAIIHLTKYTSAYVKDSRFRVNSVSPGGILDGQPEAFLRQYRDQTNGKGMLDVEDVTPTIIFLLSDSSAYLTGQNIVIDDGFSV
ncbi:oxidoreductase [Halodesulfovibrio marinisediminis]|uniref:NAD(P)-dependent dehydrogenase, short-chain alcohol dehydrogenase family n=1 Tax=Halodesulfovibrio marinisediminis DSM 17456 TaxID=1121457 RepID=A0A1N6FTV8_9BACT|nr:oxidoreductase [Halodesulfovibrio marinisediminis]SIN98660.1 NAD(P)-dependent dehydrogenase, short-chain alcohol dehydrogenase family [Halodesulfovibrio marinisediminis DSM 17456]